MREQKWEVVELAKKIRNTYVAHPEKDLTDPKLTKTQMKHWIEMLRAMQEDKH